VNGFQRPACQAALLAWPPPQAGVAATATSPQPVDGCSCPAQAVAVRPAFESATGLVATTRAGLAWSGCWSRPVPLAAVVLSPIPPIRGWHGEPGGCNRPGPTPEACRCLVDEAPRGPFRRCGVASEAVAGSRPLAAGADVVVQSLHKARRGVRPERGGAAAGNGVEPPKRLWRGLLWLQTCQPQCLLLASRGGALCQLQQSARPRFSCQRALGIRSALRETLETAGLPVRRQNQESAPVWSEQRRLGVNGLGGPTTGLSGAWGESPSCPNLAVSTSVWGRWPPPLLSRRLPVSITRLAACLGGVRCRPFCAAVAAGGRAGAARCLAWPFLTAKAYPWPKQWPAGGRTLVPIRPGIPLLHPRRADRSGAAEVAPGAANGSGTGPDRLIKREVVGRLKGAGHWALEPWRNRFGILTRFKCAAGCCSGACFCLDFVPQAYRCPLRERPGSVPLTPWSCGLMLLGGICVRARLSGLGCGRRHNRSPGPWKIARLMPAARFQHPESGP